MLFLAVFPLNLALAGMAQLAPIRYHSNLSGRLGLIWSSGKFAQLFSFFPGFGLLIKQSLNDWGFGFEEVYFRTHAGIATVWAQVV
jgi:hypothetical protein